MNQHTLACDPFLPLRVVARTLTEEPDLFSFAPPPLPASTCITRATRADDLHSLRSLRLPEGPRRHQERRSEPTWEENVERWDGLFA